jgi:hypothetical protein
MKTRLITSLLLLSCTGGCRTTVVVDGHWEELASLSADPNVDHGILDIRHEGKFRAVKVEAAGGDLDVYDIRITFGNGEVFEPGVRLHFQEGSWSRRIDFPGGHRHLRKVELWYKAAQPGVGPPRIVIWGLR